MPRPMLWAVIKSRCCRPSSANGTNTAASMRNLSPTGPWITFRVDRQDNPKGTAHRPQRYQRGDRRIHRQGDLGCGNPSHAGGCAALLGERGLEIDYRVLLYLARMVLKWSISVAFLYSCRDSALTPGARVPKSGAPSRSHKIFMNIHEYQAKELFDQFGVATPAGRSPTRRRRPVRPPRPLVVPDSW